MLSRGRDLPALLRQTLSHALDDDCLNLAQSAAYAALVALFPALIVSAAGLALLPEMTPLKVELGAFFNQVLPRNVFPLLTSYFIVTPKNPHTARALVAALFVSLLGSSSVLATLMEGLRRAAGLPNDCWTFWQRRARALVLVPLSLLPLAIATVLVIFGQVITAWLTTYLNPAVQPIFFAIASSVRWLVALAGVVGLTALIFHMGTPGAGEVPARKPTTEKGWRRHRSTSGGSWVRTLPGAILSTAMWLVTTLVFGWYVTRFANYDQVYGSLGAGVALLFWLYIVFFSVLCGAEFNAQLLVGEAREAVAPELPHTPSPPNALG